MSIRVLVASLTLSIAAVAAQAEEPKWLQDARAREFKTGAPREFKSKDNWFKARVPVKVIGETEKVDDSYTVTLDVGGDAPIYCEVVPEGFDMADMMRRTFDITMQQVAEVQGKVEAKQLEFTDAGAVGGVPYIATRWLYRVNDGKEARLGALKQVAFDKLGHGVYCAHLDIGYVKTFDTVTRTFAESFDAPPAEAAPYFVEIATATMGGNKIGVAVTTLEKDADGDTKAEQMTAMLVPGPTGDLHTQDAIHQEWLRPDATLINAAHFVASNGDLTTKVGLNFREDKWVVEGEMHGKEVTLTLPDGSRPMTTVEQSLALRKLLATDNPVGGEHKATLWMSADPSKLTDMHVKVLAKKSAAEYTASGKAGGLEFTMTLDKATGTAASMDMPMGPQSIHMERVYQKGSF